MANVVLRKHKTGEAESTPIGFSWTLLLFGSWVPLIRGDVFTVVLWWGAYFLLYVGIKIISPISIGLSMTPSTLSIIPEKKQFLQTTNK
jgi:threonine/homoserine/homoserine lactone efflux protein